MWLSAQGGGVGAVNSKKGGKWGGRRRFTVAVRGPPQIRERKKKTKNKGKMGWHKKKGESRTAPGGWEKRDGSLWGRYSSKKEKNYGPR